mmetsp:Transcript_74657/g.241402  ORF Transcript_74657/g.241402 Transcript_74657/m.241402 type:complete len:295 (+) Transcript_74657:159-1043(+)
MAHGRSCLQAAVQKGRAVAEFSLPIIAAVLEVYDAHGSRVMQDLVCRGADSVPGPVAQTSNSEAHVEVWNRNRPELVAGHRSLFFLLFLCHQAMLFQKIHVFIGLFGDDLVQGCLKVRLREGIQILVQLLVCVLELLCILLLQVTRQLVQERKRLLSSWRLVQLALCNPEFSQRVLDLQLLVCIADLLGKLESCLCSVQCYIRILGHARHPVQHGHLSKLVARSPARLNKLFHRLKPRIRALDCSGCNNDCTHHGRNPSGLPRLFQRCQFLLCHCKAFLRSFAHDVSLHDHLGC